MNMEDLYRLLRTSHVQAQGMVDTVADPLLVLDAGFRVQAANRAFFDTFKVDRYETIGQPLHELGNGQWNIPELRRLLEEVIPKAAAVINYQVQHDFPDLGRRTMLVTARTLHHPDTTSQSLMLTIVDATEEHRRLAAKDMLFREARHRMKNMLAIARSLARTTPVAGRSAEDYRNDFLGRFSALIEAEDMAFEEQKETDLSDLIDRLLAPYRSSPAAVAVNGEPVELGPKIIMALSLVLHEFATNAAKYGAFSRPGGQVRVEWRVEAGQLRLFWTESGGPPVTEPTSSGLGTHLIQSALPYSTGAKVEQSFAPTGLEAKIILPLGSAPSAG